MPLVANFTAAQPVGEPSDIELIDSSTGSDVAVTQRRAYLRTSVGSFLVPSGTSTDYIQWVYSDASIIVDVLTQDMALEIQVDWLDVSNNILYTLTKVIGFTSYNENFLYGLVQQLVANPRNIQDDDFLDNMFLTRTFIDSGNQAVLIAQDIVGAQQCYNAATNIQVKSQYYFNINA